MYASDHTPMFELKKLPYGRYRQLKRRINQGSTVLGTCVLNF